MIKRIVPLLLLIVVFTSCNNPQKNGYTYFGGKIINPKCNYVVLLDNRGFNDTIYLHSNDNTFLSKYESLEEGLYYFKHGPEHQYVYIEPKDSLLFRLNTWDFDESLVFSGRNAARNNMLIESFLENEEEAKRLYEKMKYPPNDFLKTIDSIKKLKEEKLKVFIEEKNETSKEFINVLKASLTVPLYLKLEEYAIDNIRMHSEEKLPDNFFDFRKEFESQSEELMFYNPYYNYVLMGLYTDVYRAGIDRGSEEFIVKLLDDINKKISSETIKNKLLYNVTINNFFMQPDYYKKLFFTFFKYSTSIEDKKIAQRLLNDIKFLDTEKKLPDFKIQEATGNLEAIQNLIKNKNNVIYFENHRYFSDDWVASRVSFLVKKYPDINFMVINTSSNNYIKNLAIKHQYVLPKESSAREYLTSGFPRVVLLNKKGEVVSSFNSLSSRKIEGEINNLQKK